MSSSESPKVKADFSFAMGNNAEYLESLYEQYKQDPTSVDASFQQFFAGYDFAARGTSLSVSSGASNDEGKVEAFINAYRRLGHLSAKLNPLAAEHPLRSDMSPAAHGLEHVKDSDTFHPPNLHIPMPATFSSIWQHLQATYCGNIGPDYREINDIEAVEWLQEQMEPCQNKPAFSIDTKTRALKKLIEAEGFEKFLQDRYLGQKRFSIEGLDVMIPLLDVLADESAKAGVEEITLGMAHRGRLNVLVNFMGKEYEQVLKEFEGGEFNPMMIEGDVKYHKGFANEIETFSNKKICLYLSPNPSHLEAVNPVLEGFTRARQRIISNSDTQKIVPVIIHGDAAFVGQGVVAETLNFASLPYYETGGTIHVIANNQIGFTANPEETKSCDYASDIAKFIRAPVLHVNADDPEAVMWCAILAVAYRQKFKKDFVIDLIGYRRHGHNETDEPGFTQPLMYKVIKDHPTVLGIYSEKLLREGVLSKPDYDERVKDFRDQLQNGLLAVREGRFKANIKTPQQLQKSMSYTEATEEDVWKTLDTTVNQKKLIEIGQNITEFPKGFVPHPKIAKLFETRRKMLEGSGNIDWGMAELLAFASIAGDGHHVRLSGQDCRRGTFSHRHAVLMDFNTNRALHILNQAAKGQAPVDVINSPLSEAGVLGFEFGYSVADKEALVLWEAQFGDFSNGAQIIIDQFLVASEAKWKQTASLVLLLPHGYEGQGPEHSNARPERFLQLCGNLNIQVANLTTPAQFFHILRRQVLRSFRKPLVIMTPKSLLRHPKVNSTFTEFSKENFSPVIDDKLIKDPEKVSQIIFCSGKVFYDLSEAREKNANGKDQMIPIVRVEQLYPFATHEIEKILAKYANAKEIIWTQEEPMNMGAWTFVRSRLEGIAVKQKLRFVGRPSSGSTAEGSLKSHIAEQQRIVHDALGLASMLNPPVKRRVVNNSAS